MWRLTAETALPMRDWEGDFVVYNPLSGDTHIFDIATGETLKAVTAGMADDGQIRAHIAAFLDVPDDARLADHVGGILAHLDELGLIEPADG